MEEDPEIGATFFDDVSFELISWDTLTFKMSTIQIDSIATSSAERLLVGQYNHETLGQLEAKSYVQLSPLDVEDNSLPDDAVFQQMTFTLFYDRYSYGDTTQLMEIELFKVAEEIELDDDDFLYNFSSFDLALEADGTLNSIGTASLYPRPYTKDSIEIEVDQVFSQSLFDLLVADDVDRDVFLEFLEGIQVSATSSHAIVGFLPELGFNLYYLDKSVIPTIERVIKFQPGTSDIIFNNIASDRTDTSLSELTSDDLASSVSNNQSFIQAGMGLALKIELPYIKQILASDEELLIDDVLLELNFDNKIPEEQSMVTSGLVCYQINSKNEITKVIDSYPTLSLDLEYDQNRKFIFDITEFVSEQIDINTPDNDNALLFLFSQEQFYSTLHHLVINDANSESNKSSINLNVINIKK